MTKIMFDKFSVPAIYVAMQVVLCHLGSGSTTGIMLYSGDSMSHSVPIYEGHSIPHAISRLSLAGSDITDYLCKISTKKGYAFTYKYAMDLNVAYRMKETITYVALNFEQEIEKAKHRSSVEQGYKLLDGEVINVGAERFHGLELLFQPSMVKRDRHKFMKKPIA
ncbi:actin-like [Capsicum galapagoense]